MCGSGDKSEQPQLSLPSWVSQSVWSDLNPVTREIQRPPRYAGHLTIRNLYTWRSFLIVFLHTLVFTDKQVAPSENSELGFPPWDDD